MNYLAHLYLSSDSSELIIGSILGDFVKGATHNLYTPEIRKGIDLHRKVDHYTDSHKVVRASKHIIAPSRRRFAGIMVDIFYDHFLAKDWSKYSSIPLHTFSQHVYKVLIDCQEILPCSLKRMLPVMVEQDWLTSYQNVSHIDRALNGVSRRLKRQNTLVDSAEELELNYSLFEQSFQLFFPDLIAFAQQCKSIPEKELIPPSSS